MLWYLQIQLLGSTQNRFVDDYYYYSVKHIQHPKITAVRNEVALHYHRLRGLDFLAIVLRRL